MQKVDKHISELLYTYDCVIVPNLGGFVTNYAPAKIHPVQHTFSPPSKNILFNRNLKHNDGLLVNHLASIANINFDEALKEIQHFVNKINLQLKKREKVNLHKIGVLYWDVERNIQFEPINKNYLIDSFGLTSFQSPAIIRDKKIAQRIENSFKDRGPLPIKTKKVAIKRFAMLAIGIPLVFALIWIPYKTNLFKHIAYSSINPFSSKEDTAAIVEKTDSKNSLLATDTLITKPTLTSPTSPLNATRSENVKADSTAVIVAKNEATDYKFHLVAGCFQIKENAIDYMNTLQKQNIEASIIGQNNNGLYVVSCGNFTTRNQAVIELSNLRRLQPNAWLYRN
ncbi:MAG: SPOR domain-containing protein [Bacteroidia bacterium]